MTPIGTAHSRANLDGRRQLHTLNAAVFMTGQLLVEATMKKSKAGFLWLLTLVLLARMTTPAGQPNGEGQAGASGRTSGASKGMAIKRLDGSTVSSAEIDSAVTRLMREAKVTGVGIAILKAGNVAYLKA
jgi:hypothetical protein